MVSVGRPSSVSPFAAASAERLSIEGAGVWPALWDL